MNEAIDQAPQPLVAASEISEKHQSRLKVQFAKQSNDSVKIINRAILFGFGAFYFSPEILDFMESGLSIDRGTAVNLFIITWAVGVLAGVGYASRNNKMQD